MSAVETFAEEVERRRPERENQPEECSHCGYETGTLANTPGPRRERGRALAGRFRDVVTRSASRLRAGGQP